MHPALSTPPQRRHVILFLARSTSVVSRQSGKVASSCTTASTEWECGQSGRAGGDYHAAAAAADTDGVLSLSHVYHTLPKPLCVCVCARQLLTQVF